MANTLTPSIFITKSKTAINKVFFAGNLFSNLSERMAFLSEEESSLSFLASPLDNQALQSFEFNYNREEPLEAKIRLLETSKLTEFLLLGNPATSLKLVESIERLHRRKDGQELLDQATRGIFKSNLIDAEYQLKLAYTYYFAFGSGDAVNGWSGPYSMELVGARLVHTEANTRVLEAVFIPSIHSLKAWNSRFDDISGQERAVKKFDEVLSRDVRITHTQRKEFRSNIPNDSQRQQDLWWQRRLYDNLLKTLKDEVIGKLDGNIRNLIRNYIAGVANRAENEAVVVIPYNLNKRFLNYFSNNVTAKTSPDSRVQFKAMVKALTNFLSKLGITFGWLPSTTPNSNYDATSFLNNLIPGSSENSSTVNNGLVYPGGFYMEMTYNATPEYENESVVTQIMSPLFKFYAGLKDRTVEGEPDGFDFFEESSTKILRLWKKHKILPDSASDKSVFVFGKMSEIKKVLYLDNYFLKINNIPKTSNFSLAHLSYIADTYPAGTTQRGSLVIEEWRKLYKDYVDGFVSTFPDQFSREETGKGSSFGEDGITDDIFIKSALAELLSVKDPGIFFKHNTPNSNVLSVNYELNNYIAALYGFRVTPRLDDYVIGSTRIPLSREVLMERLGAEFFNKINEKITKKLETVGRGTEEEDLLTRKLLFTMPDPEISDLIYDTLSDRALENREIAGMSIVDLADILQFMFEYDNQATSGPADTQLFVSQDQVDEAYITLLHKVQSLAPKVTIKTLPFFNRLFYFEKTCNLVGFNQPIAGMRGAPSRIAPYTGSYKVIGFSHVITTEEAYSTFSLMRTGFQQPEQQISRTLKDVLIGEIDDRIAEKEEALKKQTHTTSFNRCLCRAGHRLTKSTTGG